MLGSPNWKEAKKSAIVVEDHHVLTMGIIFQFLHNVPLTYNTPLTEIWHLVATIDYYDLPGRLFRPWFASWYSSQNIKQMKPSELLFPTWRFDHAEGFAASTKHLAYSTFGHTRESNPTELYQLHLPPRIICKYFLETVTRRSKPLRNHHL